MLKKTKIPGKRCGDGFGEAAALAGEKGFAEESRTPPHADFAILDDNPSCRLDVRVGLLLLRCQE